MVEGGEGKEKGGQAEWLINYFVCRGVRWPLCRHRRAPHRLDEMTLSGVDPSSLFFRPFNHKHDHHIYLRTGHVLYICHLLLQIASD